MFGHTPGPQGLASIAMRERRLCEMLQAEGWDNLSRLELLYVLTHADLEDYERAGLLQRLPWEYQQHLKDIPSLTSTSRGITRWREQLSERPLRRGLLAARRQLRAARREAAREFGPALRERKRAERTTRRLGIVPGAIDDWERYRSPD